MELKQASKGSGEVSDILKSEGKCQGTDLNFIKGEINTFQNMQRGHKTLITSLLMQF